MRKKSIKKLIIEFILSFFKSKEEKPDVVIQDSNIKDLLPNNKDIKRLILVFEKGIPNLFNNPNVIKIREIIKDEFGGGRNKYDLQCTEYVQYKIYQLGIVIQWPVKSGRDGGKWDIIFEKHGTYKVLNTPKPNCAVSFKEKHGIYGHIAFVEEVLENDTIKISEANFPSVGKYSERTLPKSMWQDGYKGRFIDFS